MFSAKKTTTVSDEQAMREVSALLDEWAAPEPSPWFNARMMARLREETERAPQSLFERLRDRFLFGNTSIMKPVMAGALALVVAGVGGGYLELSHMHATSNSNAVSATVQDLQILDNNDQAIQGMDQLLDDDSPQS